MHYFTNISVLVLKRSWVSSYIEYLHRCSKVCVHACALNKVEVWSSAIAARGSYVRPESLLGFCAATFAELSLAKGCK